MAEVYRAEQSLVGDISRPVALKIIRSEYSGSADFREMFLDEVRTACTLSHPNIVHFYEVGEVDGLLYMAMELVPGVSLSTVSRTLLSRGERLTDEGLLAVGILTCAALEAAHANGGLVHRDVSPQNILLAPNGTLKLIDFGIAKAATNRNLTHVGTTKGKAGYFSPEQAMGRRLDGRSDLFSLGVTLYQLASGATPLEANSHVSERHAWLVKGRWAPLERVCPGLPRGFYVVVGRALQVRPEDRYPDAAAMREELEAVALGTGLLAGPSSLAGYVQEQSGSFCVTPAGTKRPRASFAQGSSESSRARLPMALSFTKAGAALGVVTTLGLVAAGLAAWRLARDPKVAQPSPSTETVGSVKPPSSSQPPSAAVVTAESPSGATVTTNSETRPGADSGPSGGEEELVAPLPTSSERPRKENRRSVGAAPVLPPAAKGQVP